MKGKWAQGIVPRHFTWVMQEHLAVCERPGGYGPNHRRVRREEEIIWLRVQGFSRVVSLIAAPHNLHNYEEADVPFLHRPFVVGDDEEGFQRTFYPELRALVAGEGKVVLHQEELGDPVAGLMAGFLVWSAMVPDGPKAITVVERILQREMGPIGRRLVASAGTS